MDSLSPAEQYLQDFHTRVAGATSAAFGGYPASMAHVAYASSYAVLASRVEAAPNVRTVLDLACGDGHLLGLFVNDPRPIRLIGVDMSAGELELARTRLPADVTLIRERAQALSLPTESVDYVLSHMALMLMNDVDQVIREIRRVLISGGGFAAMVGRTFLLGEVFDVFLDTFRPIAKEDLAPLPMGDRRTRTTEGWTDLLRNDFDDIEFNDVDVAWRPQPEALWRSLCETYDVDRLTEGARTRLKTAFLAAIEPLREADGSLSTGWGLRLIQGRAR